MKKYIILSVNDNTDYLFYTPLTVWAWRFFGWEPILFYRGDVKAELFKMVWDQCPDLLVYRVDSIDGYRDDTITQISRLYSGDQIIEQSFVMTGDIDLIPLSDYWHPNENGITVYGHDLTGFGHYPICFIAMDNYKWSEVMKLVYDVEVDTLNANIKRDLDTLPQAKDPDFYKYWFSDQDLITQRLNEYGHDKITFINRGQGSHGYARGRVDRGGGGWVLNQPELIDAHLEQQTHHKKEKIERLYELLAHVWPDQNFDWFRTYTEKFRELTGHKG